MVRVCVCSCTVKHRSRWDKTKLKSLIIIIIYTIYVGFRYTSVVCCVVFVRRKNMTKNAGGGLSGTKPVGIIIITYMSNYHQMQC